MEENELKKRKGLARTLHDTIKEHPFWMNFNPIFMPEIQKLFQQLSDTMWWGSEITNPYYLVIRSITHDFNRMTGNLVGWASSGSWEYKKGDIILCLQSYLSNVHNLLDDKIPDDSIYGYTYNGYNIAYFKTIYNEDEKKYYVVQILKRNAELIVLRSMLKRWASMNDRKMTKTFAEDCLRQLDNGDEIIGNTWLLDITDIQDGSL